MAVDYSMVADPTRGFEQGFKFGAFIDQQRKEAEAERQAQEAQQALETAWANPSTAAISDLIIRHPQVAERAKQAWAMRSEGQQKNDTRLQAQLYMLTQNGQFDAAKQVMRDHIEELKNTPGREEAARIAEAGLAQYELNPKASMMSFGASLAVNAPDVWKNIAAKDEKTPYEKNRDFFARDYGKKAGDAYAESVFDPLVIGQPGAPVFRTSDIHGTRPQPGGGDPDSVGAGLVAQGEPRTTLPGRPEVIAAIKSGDWTAILTDPLRGKGGAPVAGGRYGAARDYGAHRATDLTGAEGTPVYSGGGSGIARVSSSKNGGNIVTIDHGGGLVTRYMHLGEVQVANGQQVGPDTPIGTLGKTGRASGPNLHFEVLANGKPVNPTKLGAVNPIRSKQQYEKLPKGARYLAPDGSIRVKS